MKTLVTLEMTQKIKDTLKSLPKEKTWDDDEYFPTQNQHQKIFNFIIQNSNISNMLACKIALQMLPYSNAILQMIEIKFLGNEQEVHNNIVIETIEHDYIGLKCNDDDFLPRLKKNIS